MEGPMVHDFPLFLNCFLIFFNGFRRAFIPWDLSRQTCGQNLACGSMDPAPLWGLLSPGRRATQNLLYSLLKNLIGAFQIIARFLLYFVVNII